MKGEPRFRRYRRGEGDEFVQVAEENCTFSSAGSGGLAMFSILNSRLLHRSFLMRLLQTTGLSLALMTATAAGVHAEDVTVQGVAGVDGADGVNPGDLGQPGGDGESVVANAGGVFPNKATAIGGNGGVGGTNFFECPPCETGGAKGGRGGDASAGATTTIISGPAEADATSIGRSGGIGGGVDEGPDQGGGDGGLATGTATASTGSGSATASATANGGSGGFSDGGSAAARAVGGDASASSTAITAGTGDASSSASATGGAAGDFEFPFGVLPSPGNATATAAASATGGGKAIATAVAAAGFPSETGGFGPPPATGTANATATAETVSGAMAKALSTINPNTDEAAGTSEATAKTSFRGVSVQSDATNTIFPDFVTVEAIAQGGSGQSSLDQGVFLGAISTALPDKAYATTLIGDARSVAEALLGPGDEIFGTSILSYPGSSTFNFSFRGDLILGVIDGGADIIVNGTELFAVDGFVEDTVFDLGSFGPNIELTITGTGTFAFGGAVPEPSTWAMLMLGFAGLGLIGYRQTRGAKPQAA
jgi:PEP-CTERM motif-containing protein